jgi:AsmA protein
MNRALILSAAGLSALLIGAALLPWTVSSRALRDEIAGQLARVTGVPVASDGDASFALLPFPRVKLENVRLGQPGQGACLEIAIARGEVRLLPLLAGRLELLDLALVEPVLKLDSRWPSEANAAQQLGHAVDILFAAPLAHGRLRSLSVTAGRIESVAADKPVTILDEVNGAMKAPRGATATVSGTFRWRGSTAEFEASGFDPGEYERSRQSAVTLSLDAPYLKASFSGTASGPELQFNGDFSGETPDLVSLGGWLGFEPPLSTTEGVAVAGQARLEADALSISSARFRIGGQDLDGALLGRAEADGLNLSGTLAASTLDLTGLAGSLLPGRADDGGWSRDPFPLWRLPRASFDVRLSVGSLVVGPVAMENAALAMLSRGSRTDLTLAGADYQGGTLKGRLGVAAQPQGAVDIKLQASAEKIATGTGLAFLFDGKRLSGTGSALVQLEGSGDTMASLMRSLEGRASLGIRQGELVGINIVEALRRIERRPLGAALDFGGGRTPFEAASATFRISQGTAVTSDGIIQSAAAKIALAGDVNLAERSFAMSGLASAPASATGREPPTLPFEITGSFDQPQIVPDARDLIRRSGAAAPFLLGPAAKSSPRPAYDAERPVGSLP